jgi:hypothetical protein
MKKTKIATFLDGDLLKWVIEQARKLRVSESSVIRKCVADKMEEKKDDAV